jgi:hypothetical protein
VVAEAVIPIMFAEVAGSAHGASSGLINTCRFAVNATFAHASPLHLYLSLSAFTLLRLMLFREYTDAAAPLSPSRIGHPKCSVPNASLHIPFALA